MKILVVDDEEGARELFNTILTDEGYDVTLANNGADALTRMQGDVYDLVVTDIKMPGMDGLQLLQSQAYESFTQFESHPFHGIRMEPLGSLEDELALPFIEKVDGADIRMHVAGNDTDDSLEECLRARRVADDPVQLADIAQ